MADTADLKSAARFRAYGFESRLRHFLIRLKPCSQLPMWASQFAVNPPTREPVWGGLLAGRIYEIPPENALATDSGTVYVDVPCYDSPAVLTERRVGVR